MAVKRKKSAVSVVVDLDAAREIARERVRLARKAELAKLDVEFMLALERGQDTSAVVARKQELRDATNDESIAKAKKVEDLLTAKPAGLEIF